jgi:glycosyltransferase involved in cell wall biosynthesis
MMERQLIQIVESSARHQWFEELVFEIQENIARQSVVTLEPRGQLFSVMEEKNIFITGGKKTFTILNIWRAACSVKKIGLGPESCLVVAHGHKASISAMVSKLLFDIDYGIVHHQSPIVFFDSLRSRHPIRGNIHTYLYRHYVKRAKFIQALSLEVFNSVSELGYPKNQIILLGHGIASKNFRSSTNFDSIQKPREGQNETILMVGRLSWEKNYLLAFKVFKELVKKCPRLKVIIAGTGPDFDNLTKVRNELGLQRHVELVGWQPNISELMFEADLFLHLSLTESYGQVLLEACLSDLDVFTFPVGVALDLESAGNPLIHILKSTNPQAISAEISIFLQENKKHLSGRVSPNLVEHSVDFVHKAMVDYLIAQSTSV